MTGVNYFVDDSGRKTSVILDLRKHGRVWEDLHDRILIESRRKEPRMTLAQVQQRLSRRLSKSQARSHG